jgi:hypothetical protein
MKAKVKEIDSLSLSLSLKIDMLRGVVIQVIQINANPYACQRDL